MRGEEDSRTPWVARTAELPPHARRRGIAPRFEFFVGGITSACAEKSVVVAVAVAFFRNYLRMRGEEIQHWQA